MAAISSAAAPSSSSMPLKAAGRLGAAEAPPVAHALAHLVLPGALALLEAGDLAQRAGGSGRGPARPRWAARRGRRTPGSARPAAARAGRSPGHLASLGALTRDASRSARSACTRSWRANGYAGCSGLTLSSSATARGGIAGVEMPARGGDGLVLGPRRRQRGEGDAGVARRRRAGESGHEAIPVREDHRAEGHEHARARGTEHHRDPPPREARAGTAGQAASSARRRRKNQPKWRRDPFRARPQPRALRARGRPRRRRVARLRGRRGRRHRRGPPMQDALEDERRVTGLVRLEQRLPFGERPLDLGVQADGPPIRGDAALSENPRTESKLLVRYLLRKARAPGPRPPPPRPAWPAPRRSGPEGAHRRSIAIQAVVLVLALDVGAGRAALVGEGRLALLVERGQPRGPGRRSP